MATLQLLLSHISSVKISSMHTNCIIIDCDMNSRGHEDAISQICEQMGDSAFITYVKNMIPKEIWEEVE